MGAPAAAVVAEDPGGSDEPSPANVWFKRKMALHDSARVASLTARQHESVSEKQRTAALVEQGRRVDFELQWNRSRVKELRDRVECVLAPRRAARDLTNKHAQHKHKPTSVFLSYPPGSDFDELSMARAIADEINNQSAANHNHQSAKCWLDLDVLPRETLNDVNARELFRADALVGATVVVVLGGTKAYEKSRVCGIERKLVAARLERPEHGGDGDENLVVVVVDVGSLLRKGTHTAVSPSTKEAFSAFKQFIERYEDSVTAIDAFSVSAPEPPGNRRFNDCVARRVAAAVADARVFVTRTFPLNTHMPPLDTNGIHDALHALAATSAYWRDDATTTQKSSLAWSTRRVVEWLKSKGGFTMPLLPRFDMENVHGSVVSTLSDEVLKTRFGVNDAPVRIRLLGDIRETFPKLLLEKNETDCLEPVGTAATARGGIGTDDAQPLASTVFDGDDSSSLPVFHSLRVLLDNKLSKFANGGSATVAERDAFCALFEAVEETFSVTKNALVGKQTVGLQRNTPTQTRNAFLLAACDVHVARSPNLPKRVDWRGFAAAAVETLKGEFCRSESSTRENALVAFESGDDNTNNNKSRYHQLPSKLILRAAIEHKLRLFGVAYREHEQHRANLDDANFTQNCALAIEDLVRDRTLDPTCAAGARASLVTFSLSKTSETADFVDEWVELAFRVKKKEHVDLAVSVAVAKVEAMNLSKAKIQTRRGLFETTLRSVARRREETFREHGLREGLLTVTNSLSPIEAWRHAVFLMEKFVPFAGDDDEPMKINAYATVLSQGTETNRRALRVCAVSSQTISGRNTRTKRVGSEFRAWEGVFWPAVGLRKLDGPLPGTGDESSDENLQQCAVVDTQTEYAVPAFATAGFPVQSQDEDFSEHDIGTELDDSETPRGVLVVTLVQGEESTQTLSGLNTHTSARLSASQKEIVQNIACAVGVALNRFSKTRKEDRESLIGNAREVFNADSENRERRKQHALEVLQEKRQAA